MSQKRSFNPDPVESNGNGDTSLHARSNSITSSDSTPSRNGARASSSSLPNDTPDLPPAKRARHSSHHSSCTDSLCKGCAAGQLEISFSTAPSAAELYRIALEERDGGDHKGKDRAPQSKKEVEEKRARSEEEESERPKTVIKLFELAIEKFEDELGIEGDMEPLSPSATLPGPLPTRLLYGSCLVDWGVYLALPQSIQRGASVFRSCLGEAEQEGGSALASTYMGLGRALVHELIAVARRRANRHAWSEDEDGSEDDESDSDMEEEDEDDLDLEKWEKVEKEALHRAFRNIEKGLIALLPDGDGARQSAAAAGTSAGGSAGQTTRSAGPERYARDAVKMADMFWEYFTWLRLRKGNKTSQTLPLYCLRKSLDLLNKAREQHPPTCNTPTVLLRRGAILQSIVQRQSEAGLKREEYLALLRECDTLFRTGVMTTKMEIEGVDKRVLFELLFRGAQTCVTLMDNEEDEDLVLQAYENARTALMEAKQLDPHSKDVAKMMRDLTQTYEPDTDEEMEGFEDADEWGDEGELVEQDEEEEEEEEDGEVEDGEVEDGEVDEEGLTKAERWELQKRQVWEEGEESEGEEDGNGEEEEVEVEEGRIVLGFVNGGENWEEEEDVVESSDEDGEGDGEGVSDGDSDGDQEGEEGD
ncbi:hypothetical protein HDV00_003293 [Rhizophlyctis rosea]|nr:hypothetical protein HDV00_003293 [Rhizophlyctis rosea]